jgi:DNA-binding GntR family transcriptional regulator
VTTIADRIFIELRDSIVEGVIQAGSKISEPELSQRFDVSRASLREALGRLERCNLVTRKANVGARVASLSSDGLLEIYHVREALEGMSARLAAENMSAQEIKALQELLTMHQQSVAQNDDAAYFQKEGDLDFHYRIVQGSHNSRLIGLLCNDLYHQMRMYRYQFGMQSRRAKPALLEHGHIVDAIADHDAEMAELLMRRHIRSSRKNVEQLLKATNEG